MSQPDVDAANTAGISRAVEELPCFKTVRKQAAWLQFRILIFSVGGFVNYGRLLCLPANAAAGNT